jgi:type II secretory pathway pseudopilin PulG
MSNVLIGIIGVILFIGLALAGALFLGPRFQESSNVSKASAIAAQMQQVANAINMYQVDTGTSIPSTASDTVSATLVASRHLKSVPVNPVSGSLIAAVNKGGGADSGPATHLYTNIGTDESAKSICLAIEKNAGSPNPELTAAPTPNFGAVVAANRRLGCFADSYYTPAIYQAYMPI